MHAAVLFLDARNAVFQPGGTMVDTDFKIAVHKSVSLVYGTATDTCTDFCVPKTSGIDLNRHTQTHIKWLFPQSAPQSYWVGQSVLAIQHLTPQILVIHSSHNSPRKLFEGLNAFAKLSRVNYPSIETFFF